MNNSLDCVKAFKSATSNRLHRGLYIAKIFILLLSDAISTVVEENVVLKKICLCTYSSMDKHLRATICTCTRL